MCLLVFLLFVVMLNPPLAEGAEIYVKADAAGANDGTSWINACTSLQSALAVAVNGDEIWVAAGSYRPHASDRNVPFVMKNGVALYGGFAGNETAREQRNAAVNVTVLTGDLEDDDTNKVQGVTTTYTDIVGNNSRRVVSAIGLNSTVVLDGFTLTAALGNEMSDMGGGIFINSSDFTITDCTFSGNFSGDGGAVFSHINNTLVFVGCTFSGNGAGREGGGMYNYHRDATLTDCIFLGNSALRGGGLFIQQGSPTLTNCTFSGNIAGEAGGGVYQGNDSPSLTNCLFSGNSATVDGGGLFNYFGNIQLNGCTFSDNHAEKGGGLYSLTGSATLTGCTLSGNSAASGGGIRFFEGSFALTNCTFSGNSSTETGGGLYNVKGSATLTNCTLSGNTASSGAVAEGWTGAVLAASNCIFWNEGALEIFGGDKPLIIYSIVQGSFPGTGNMADNPNLGSLADNGGPAKTHALPPGSSAVDAGTSAGAPATDQRGVTRPHGAGIDMGAYERLPEPVYVNAAATGANNGVSWADAYTDLQTALLFGGGEIWVAAGSYAPTAGTDRTKSFVLKSGLALYGGFNGTETGQGQRDPAVHPTILTGDIGIPGDSGDNSYHVVYSSGADVTAVLDGFTITGGCANAGDENPSNPQNSGGGMYSVNSSPAVTGCIFSGNRAFASGGGMFNTQSSPTVTNSVFSGNTANSGGGMVNQSESSPTVTNCTFTGNSAGIDGGGMVNRSNSNPTVTNSTFSGNSASTSGGGMYNYNSSPTVVNSILWGASGGEIVNSGTSVPSLSFCVVQGGYWGGTGILEGDPKLGPLADNGGPTQTHALLAHSSALGAGISAGAPGADQRGITRPQGVKYDIGAYEADAGSVTVTITPEEARIAGAQWSLDGGTTWKNSGETASDILPGSYTVTFKDVTDWTKPEDQAVTVTKDATVTVEKTCVRHTGNVRVNITGPSGARWSIDGTEWKNSGETITGLPTGVYTVLFNEVNGWTKPANRNAAVNKDQLTVADVQYTVIPTPIPVQPVIPPLVPPGNPLPSGSVTSTPVPLVVNLPPKPTPEEKREALTDLLVGAGIPGGLAEDITPFLDVDGAGNVFVSGDGMDRLRELLENVEIPDGAEGIPLPFFQASLTGGAGTAIVFFAIPEGFIGKRCDSLQVVKMFSSTETDVFSRVFSLDALLDGCSAVVEVEGDPGDETLVRVLDADDAFTANCRLALAIRDGGRYDLDGEENGTVTDPAFMVEGEVSGAPDDPQRSGSGGCSAGGLLIPSAVLFLAPLALLAAGRKK